MLSFYRCCGWGWWWWLREYLISFSSFAFPLCIQPIVKSYNLWNDIDSDTNFSIFYFSLASERSPQCQSNPFRKAASDMGQYWVISTLVYTEISALIYRLPFLEKGFYPQNVSFRVHPRESLASGLQSSRLFHCVLNVSGQSPTLPVFHIIKCISLERYVFFKTFIFKAYNLRSIVFFSLCAYLHNVFLCWSKCISFLAKWRSDVSFGNLRCLKMHSYAGYMHLIITISQKHPMCISHFFSPFEGGR